MKGLIITILTTSGSSSYCSSGYDSSTPSGHGTIGSNYSNGASQPVGSRFLLREDDMTQLEFNSAGFVARSKQRRLLLLNDLLVAFFEFSNHVSDVS